MKKENEEIEVVYTDIDIADIEKRLEKIGAKKIQDIFYQDIIFDHEDLRLNNKGAWIRLRSREDKVTLAYKQRLGMNQGNGEREDQGMKEIEIKVSDFEKTAELILNAGLIVKIRAEKKRIRWQKKDVVFDIDTWPELNPYLEIESDNMEKIDKAILELGLDLEKKRIINQFSIYRENGIEPLDYKEMTFQRLIKKEEE